VYRHTTLLRFLVNHATTNQLLALAPRASLPHSLTHSLKHTHTHSAHGHEYVWYARYGGLDSHLVLSGVAACHIAATSSVTVAPIKCL
jgi:hypothetical protein